MNTYLADGDLIPVSPDVAAAIGVNHAIVLQQLHFLLTITQKSKNKYNRVDGEWWVYNSYPEWKRDYFKWLSISAIKSIFNDLEERKLIITRQGVKSAFDRKKWYRIDYSQLETFLSSIGQKMSHEMGQKMSDDTGQKMSDVYTENTPETTPDKKKAHNKAVNGMIGAYLEANQSIATGDFKSPTIKGYASDLIKAGITSDQVFNYIRELRRQPFWTDKAVSLHYVLANITPWLTKQKPSTNGKTKELDDSLLVFTQGAQDGN